MRRTMLVLLACAAAAGFGVRFGDALWAQAKEEAKMLFDFENADDAAQWEAANAATSIVAEHATSGKSAMKVVLEGAEYPGINTAKIANDWSGYKELKFDVFADQAFNLAVRIDDENSKDYASRRGLLGMVSRRRRLLDYVKRVNPEQYLDLLRRLEIRK